MEAPTVHSAGDISPRGAAFIGWSTAVIFLAIIAVVCRFLSRRVSSNYGSDDWTIFLGLCLATCLYSTGVVICTVGFAGFPQDSLNLSQLETFLLLVFIDNILYATTLPIIKISILLLYRRIFTVPAFHRAALVVGLLVTGWMIATVFAQVFSCTPVKASWKPLLAEHCINSRAFYFGNAISNLLLDVVILCLPIPMVWSLHLSPRRKASLYGIFLLGGFVCICSILRIVYLGQIDLKNITYSDAKVGIWTNVECCVGIICACLPTLPNFLRLWYKKAKTLISSPTKHTATDYDKNDRLGAQKPQVRGAAKTDLGNGYEELKDAHAKRWGHKPDDWVAINVTDEDIGLQPVKIRHNV